MGLRAGDLKNLVDKIVEIDAYKSKMGSDSDIIVINFTVANKEPANDLINFIEKGYNFVLDADISSGEQDKGLYIVFVEIERNNNAPQQIMELMSGIYLLTDRKDFRFRFYKGFKSHLLNLENLIKIVPLEKDNYLSTVKESNMNNLSNFFGKSYLEYTKFIAENRIVLKKSYAEPLYFYIKNFGPSGDINKSITETINVNDYAEILFFTKYIGDYNITKFGRNIFTLENADYTLVLERI